MARTITSKVARTSRLIPRSFFKCLLIRPPWSRFRIGQSTLSPFDEKVFPKDRTGFLGNRDRRLLCEDPDNAIAPSITDRNANPDNHDRGPRCSYDPHAGWFHSSSRTPTDVASERDRSWGGGHDQRPHNRNRTQRHRLARPARDRGRSRRRCRGTRLYHRPCPQPRRYDPRYDRRRAVREPT